MLHISIGINRGFLLGDSAYGLSTFLLTPYKIPNCAEQDRFNAAHMKTRVKVECTIGILKARFGCQK